MDADVDPATTPLSEWLGRLAEPNGAPGGGAASAVLAAIAAGLLGMVAAYTENEQASAAEARLAAVREAAARLAEDDGIASAAFGEALAMPAGAAREAALRPAAVEAVSSSLGIGDVAATLIPEAELLARIGNTHVEADLLVALRALHAALEGALITAQSDVDLLSRHRVPHDQLDETVDILQTRIDDLVRSRDRVAQLILRTPTGGADERA